MGGIRKYKRRVAKFYASENGVKANKHYTKKNESGKTDDSEGKSGVRIFFERLFGKEAKN